MLPIGMRFKLSAESYKNTEHIFIDSKEFRMGID